MRTSNKILLGTFLTAILVLSVIHIALYAKYKNGHYTTLKSIRYDNFNHHTLQNITAITATGMENLNIIPSDTARLDIEKDDRGYVRFEIKDGTLILRGDSIVHRPGEADDTTRSYQQVDVYLPSLQKLSADNSAIHIKGSKDSSSATSYELDLKNRSSFDFQDTDDTTYFYFRNILINADKSDIGFHNYSKIDSVHLELGMSNFHDNSAVIGKLSIKLDNFSKINIQGKNLQTAELTK